MVRQRMCVRGRRSTACSLLLHSTSTLLRDVHVERREVADFSCDVPRELNVTVKSQT